MPPSIKPGTVARYWREAEAVSRLSIAIQRDETLGDAEREPVLTAAEALKTALVSLAKTRAA